MIYHQLGISSLHISEIGFGCMSLEADQASVTNLLHEAIDNGINFFDTADLYHKGLNEEMIGGALAGKRNEVIIASKAGNQWREDGSGWDWNPSKNYILACAEKSLQRLRTDHIDLYQLHGGTINDPIDETIEAFELLLQQGKIRYYGISSIRPNVIREYIKRSSIVSVMMQYGLLDRRPEEECLGLLEENKIGLLTRGSLASGLLAGKPAREFLGYTAEQVQLEASQVQVISNEKRTAAQTAIRYVLQNPVTSAAVIGIRTANQLREAIAAANSPQLTRTEIEQLQNVIPANRYENHR